jgi:hypothetical protein
MSLRIWLLNKNLPKLKKTWLSKISNTLISENSQHMRNISYNLRAKSTMIKMKPWTKICFLTSNNKWKEKMMMTLMMMTKKTLKKKKNKMRKTKMIVHHNLILNHLMTHVHHLMNKATRMRTTTTMTMMIKRMMIKKMKRMKKMTIKKTTIKKMTIRRMKRMKKISVSMKQISCSVITK